MIDNTLVKGLMSNPRAIGFATSSGLIDLLLIYLHKLGKISMGQIIKHQWFKKPFADQKQEPLFERKLMIKFSKKRSNIFINVQDRN